MEWQRQTNKRLFEEHAATLNLLARVERVFGGRAATARRCVSAESGRS